MDVREKLVELLKEIVAIQERGFGDPRPTYETVASYLISHGVTVQDNTEISDELLERLRKAPVTVMTEEPTVEAVQEWIPVKDRLPEEYTCVLVCDVREDYVAEWEYRRNGIWDHEGCSYDNSDLTHWMPLPQPPKGE